MAQVTPLAAVEAMKSRVDSIAGAHGIPACHTEMYKLPMRQNSVSTRLPPKVPGPAAQNMPTNTGNGSITQQKQRLPASFTMLKPSAVRRPGTAPSTGQHVVRSDSIAAYGESVLASATQRSNESLQEQRVAASSSLPCPQTGAPSRVVSGSWQSDLTSHLAAAATTHECSRKLSACRSARSQHLQQYLETPSCTPTSRVSLVHGTPHRPADKPVAPTEDAQQPLAVGAFWDSSEARAPTSDANGAVGVDLLTYMTSTSYAASAAHTGDSGDCCRPSTVPNMRSSGRRQSNQEGSKARPSTSSAAQHPRLDAIIGPWGSAPGELPLQDTAVHGRKMFVSDAHLSLCRRGLCCAKRGTAHCDAVGAAQLWHWHSQGGPLACWRAGASTYSLGCGACRGR